ncbi:hypothetical protein I6U48_23545 [Clostridium sp. PL3]|uniref:Uncharacterized protein n=1 Tax=Clostridium thailandense TaxID=2794346 RepID=A0A949TN12_9CLOT|nr:hypothetical protein [Clostridium thailandense]MBV7275874.1 hypothetical protein [Clostridium thailandense]
MNIEKLNKLREKFKLRNIKARYIDTLEDTKLCTLNIIPSSCTIGIGHSVILQRIDTTNSLLERENK